MNTEMLIAVGSCALSFLAFRLFFSLLNKNLNVELPDLIGFAAGLIIIAVLYAKRGFFFGGNSIITGVSIGLPLSMLWSITGAGLIGEVLGVIISFRSMAWFLAIVSGLYFDIWNKYGISVTPQIKMVILIVMVLLFALGTVLMMLPEFYIKNIMKKNGFTLNTSVPTGKRVFTQVIGFIVILVCSSMLSEIASLIDKLFS